MEVGYSSTFSLYLIKVKSNPGLGSVQTTLPGAELHQVSPSRSRLTQRSEGLLTRIFPAVGFGIYPLLFFSSCFFVFFLLSNPSACHREQTAIVFHSISFFS